MADKTEVVLDRSQVKKAVQALLAFLNSKASQDQLLLDDTHQISLLLTMWKVPKEAQTIRIPLLNGQRSDSDEVCLFTRDEPKMTSEQTQRFYKRLLEERGVKNISEIIPLKVLKTEYKPHEAKRRLLGNFDMFLSDDRVRRLLPSHIGKHFYDRKKEPLSVNLQSKNLARDIQRLVQGTYLKVNNRGSCCMVRVAHSGMTADEVTENIEAAVQTVMAKIRMKGPVIKVIHLKSQTSVSLPIYHSDLSLCTAQANKGAPAAKKQKRAVDEQTEKKKADATQNEEVKDIKADDEEEEIPQLVPIQTPSKKPKFVKKPKKKQLKIPPKPAAAKTGKKNKLTKKTGKKNPKGKVHKIK